MSTATAPALRASDATEARVGDRLFKSVAALAASTITIVIGLIAIFLLVKAIPALRANHANFFTSAQFKTTDSNHLAFGIRDLFMVTLLSSTMGNGARRADRDRHRGVPDSVRAGEVIASFRRHRRSAGRGAVDRLRTLGNLRSGTATRADRDPAQPQVGLVVSVQEPATYRWPAAATSSPPASYLP